MLDERLAEAANLLERHLSEVIIALDKSELSRAMAYALKGGKRLRGFLVLESARLHYVQVARAIWPAAAIEAMHSYSLVHDDLPSMDNDDLRRGRATVHIKWNEATAILVGDALQALAFELASHPDCGTGEIRADLSSSLARAAGARGMVIGQALDIAAETSATPLTLEQIIELQRGKTGALFEWSAMAGPRLAGNDTAAMQRYAQALGLAFQIQDDIIDVTGDAATAGKAVGKDDAAGKATFVSLLGLEGARTRAQDLTEEAIEALSCYGPEAENLRALARFVTARRN